MICMNFDILQALFMSDYAELRLLKPGGAGMNAVLLQPTTYMNIIGQNVSKAAKHFKIDKTKIYVVHDELEHKLGKVRVVKGTSFK